MLTFPVCYLYLSFQISTYLATRAAGRNGEQHTFIYTIVKILIYILRLLLLNISMPKIPTRLKLPSKASIKSLFTRKRVLIAGSVLIAFLLFTPLITYAYYARDISDRERLMNHNNTGIVLKDKNGEVFYEYGRVNSNNNVPLSQISDHVEKALVASEDKDFYKHEGYSVHGIARALYGNVLNKDATKYGGSTITQQLVKNNLLSSDKNYLRKYQEISMAVAVERHYTKDEILDMYLNSVYFGEGAFGIGDAAKAYFNKSPADLSVAESAMLVGRLPAPNAYSPVSGDKELAARQQDRVLTRMVERGYIKSDDKKAAKSQNLTYSDGTTASTFEHAQHYALMVLDELYNEYGEERVTRSGFEVTTALDLSRQKDAEAIIKKRIASYESMGGKNASLVAIDPKTGYVEALVGSVDWNNTSFGKVNMAITPRQPGSSFKPIYYTEAIDKKLITAATVLKDEPRTFGTWKPQNYDFRFRGDITVRNALAQSLNIPAAEVMQKLGPEKASQAAGRMGITTVNEPEKYGLTLALGTAEAKLTEMTNAYAAFANNGEQFEPVMVTNISDKFNHTVFQHDEQRGTRVMGRGASFIISSILSDTTARAPLYGSSLNISGRQVAVKTGTTDENKDAWTIGYTPGMTIGVWVGNNENQPMRSLAGGSSAGMIWRDAMTSFVSDMPVERFEMPSSGITQVNVCRGTELRAASSGANTYSEYFINGSEPSGVCNAARPVEEKVEEKKEEEPSEQDPTKREETPAENNGGNGNNGTDNQPGDDGTDTTEPPTTTNPGTGQGGRGGGTEEPPTTTPPPNSGGTTPASP
ncbi:MAG: putative Peptidoglycan glycosyltransferase [Candidatus Saccharibacteria bacterium]|nr:putative Peptidoglycan glycosyltransferase [Candidatus Saccharibacteria bacterium]